MKKQIIKIFIIFCSVFSSLSFQTIWAHPVLPPELMEYLQENPNASEEQVSNFIVKEYWESAARQFFGVSDGNINPDDIQEFTIDENTQKIKENTEIIRNTWNKDKNFLENAKDFTILWIEHILSWADHVLFVLSLILVLMPWKKLLLLITSFTIAHSVTLILSWSEILSLSANIVEPIIAFSIAYIAITSVFLRKYRFFANIHNKIFVVFVFWLFHGLGFAWVFTEIKIPPKEFLPSLLFFNVWVEIWQIIILLFAFIVLILLKKNEKIYKITIPIAALWISAISLFWVVERIFF